MTIVETTDNRFFGLVGEMTDVPQCWLAVEMKRTKGGFVPKAKARAQLVRKAGCRIVQEG